MMNDKTRVMKRLLDDRTARGISKTIPVGLLGEAKADYEADMSEALAQQEAEEKAREL